MDILRVDRKDCFEKVSVGDVFRIWNDDDKAHTLYVMITYDYGISNSWRLVRLNTGDTGLAEGPRDTARETLTRYRAMYDHVEKVGFYGVDKGRIF